jgi:transposase
VIPSPAFIKGVCKALPNARITFDKFHILKIISAGVDKVRKAEVKDNPILKGTRYLFLKNAQNLTKKQQGDR